MIEHPFHSLYLCVLRDGMRARYPNHSQFIQVEWKNLNITKERLQWRLYGSYYIGGR